ncbi:hypothetical protein GNI_033970 [Gregarina niphandrodes]|uniref:Uncharacterized protein n=1 Tax=Gregarina niphandrodes TaxID=110365 RepID=A0A023BAU7_GRENI|nr:hypothetical protein GNI_033970 [Gregarina niphandrodes]EZG78642.1 hypothetical protein GNI_033970 [Gregarina niphandrodes]|eukprot:XP_011129233.1 hypothetical protein GNI_033970 [Gregarina niphandrodes]
MMGMPQLFEDRPWPSGGQQGSSSPAQSPATAPVKRGRGRPRKHPLPAADAAKTRVKAKQATHRRVGVYGEYDSPSPDDGGDQWDPASSWPGEYADYGGAGGWTGEYYGNAPYGSPSYNGYPVPDYNYGSPAPSAAPPPGTEDAAGDWGSPYRSPLMSGNTGSPGATGPGMPGSGMPGPGMPGPGMAGPGQEYEMYGGGGGAVGSGVVDYMGGYDAYKYPSADNTQVVPRMQPTRDQGANRMIQWHTNPTIRSADARSFYKLTGYVGAPQEEPATEANTPRPVMSEPSTPSTVDQQASINATAQAQLQTRLSQQG